MNTETPTTSCIEWTGCVDRHGYGKTTHNKKYMAASRMTWIKANGDPGLDLCVMHTCDNPKCVNLAHLRLGTKGDNSRDMAEKGRSTFGTKNAGCKLTEQQVDWLRARPMPAKDMAAKLGVSVVTVHKILRGAKWARYKSPLESGKFPG